MGKKRNSKFFYTVDENGYATQHTYNDETVHYSNPFSTSEKGSLILSVLFAGFVCYGLIQLAYFFLSGIIGFLIAFFVVGGATGVSFGVWRYKAEPIFKIILTVIAVIGITIGMVGKYVDTDTSAQTKNQTFVFPRVGTWKLTGKDSKNWTANMVIEEIDTEKFSGYFDWSGGNYSSGREYFRGEYDPETGKVTMQGYRLENNSGSKGLSNYEAYITKNNNDFKSGKWDGGGKWKAKGQ